MSLPPPTPAETAIILVLDHIMETHDPEVYPARLCWTKDASMTHFDIHGEHNVPYDGDVAIAGLTWSPDASGHPARIIRQVSRRCAIAAQPHIWKHVWLIHEHHDMQRTIEHFKDVHPDLRNKLANYTLSFAFVHWPHDWHWRASYADGKKSTLPMFRSLEYDGFAGPLPEPDGKCDAKYARVWTGESISGKNYLSFVDWMTIQVKLAWRETSSERHLILYSPLTVFFEGPLRDMLRDIHPSVHRSLDLRRAQWCWESADEMLLLEALLQGAQGRITLLNDANSLEYSRTDTPGTPARPLDLQQCSTFVTNDPYILVESISPAAALSKSLLLVKDRATTLEAAALRKSLLSLREILSACLDKDTGKSRHDKRLTPESVIEMFHPLQDDAFGSAIREIRQLCLPSNSRWTAIGRSEAQEIADAFNAYYSAAYP